MLFLLLLTLLAVLGVVCADCKAVLARAAWSWQYVSHLSCARQVSQRARLLVVLLDTLRADRLRWTWLAV